MNFFKFLRRHAKTSEEKVVFLVPKGVSWTIEDLYELEANGNYREALEGWKILLSPFEKFKTDPRVINLKSHRVIWIHIGLCCRHLEMYSKALEAYDKALALANEAEDSDILAEIHNCIGVVHRHMGNIDEALRQNKRALQEAKSIWDIEKIVAIRDNIAHCYGDQGRLHKALKEEMSAYGMLLSAPSKVLPRTHATVLGNLGFFNWKLGNNQAGIRYMEKGLVKAREAGDRKQEDLVSGYLRSLGAK